MNDASSGALTHVGALYWFRHDLRLHDAPALCRAVQTIEAAGGWCLPVFVVEPSWRADTPWGFARMRPHRRRWWAQALAGLSVRLQALGSRLQVWQGDAVQVLAQASAALGGVPVYCEDIAAPEEAQAVQRLRAAGVTVHTHWQSTLFDPHDLPFEPAQVPQVFTAFRQALERAGAMPAAPWPELQRLPPLPAPALLQGLAQALPQHVLEGMPMTGIELGASSFPYASDADFAGTELAACAHVRRYCARGLPHRYKSTRDATHGLDHSTHWSPWLATGALSARWAWAQVAQFEAEHGASVSSGWIRFELLWRDHFRWLHHRYGRRLYQASGLSAQAPPTHDAQAFGRWCEGRTGQALVDAGMRELRATGYLSNRMRQVVASALIHEQGGDWRAGAAWFESCLIDYDVYSNQGNWLYISGRGTDPRGGRRFDADKQARQHDPHGVYRRLWGTA